MSLKPKKHSDQIKIAEKMKQKQSKMNTKYQLPPYTLIVSEGVKTEPLYLNGLVNKINEQYKSIAKENHIFVHGTGRNTKGLLRYVEKRVDNGEWEKYENIWLVYDLFEVVTSLGSLQEAKRRAKIQYKKFMDQGITAPSKMIPATRVYEVVEELEKYLHS